MSSIHAQALKQYGEYQKAQQKKAEAAKKKAAKKKAAGKLISKAKKKDPEAPYSDNPTPGKPGWNLAKAKRKKAAAVAGKGKKA